MRNEQIAKGAIRAAREIGKQLAGKPNHPSFWTDETYRDLAALIYAEMLRND